MDFWLTDDHEALQEGIRSFVDGRFPLDAIAEREETDAVVDLEKWRELGELGVFSLRADGFDFRSAVLAFEELGRGLVPGPLVLTHLATGLIDGAADGSALVGHYEPGDNATLIEHHAQLTDLLWLRDDGIVRLDPALLTTAAVERPLDPLSPITAVLESVSGEMVGSSEDSTHARLAGTLLTAALQVGIANAALDVSTTYAKEREQFGRPIGSFQAVKHLLAEMLVKAEVARSAVYAAACALDGASDDAPTRAVSVAKVMAGDAAIFGGRTGIQVHGGMGFTWEVHIQRYWKRAIVLDNTFGSSDHHAVRVAATLTNPLPSDERS
ncbi:MAG: acyl-CoA/acyl-ACP dehydrogenase [Acidimicrobiales bacterium]|nr:acyl-CoA/acyl-ACP dehydrogenase [Acidimicrobiales bacterium]MDG2217555.1 acyl-CoA/acyl-ACP dehydrogenase [Acidimicrobiales bacterium]